MNMFADVPLTGEQKKVLCLSETGPVLIKGGAGSGKTLIAVKRAEALAKSGDTLFGQATVGFFAFNKTLVSVVKKALAGNRAISADNIDSWTFVRLCKAVKDGRVELDANKWIVDDPKWGRGLKRVDNELVARCLEMAKEMAFAAIADHVIAQKSIKFYEEEVRWLKGRRIKTLEAYVATPRTGRGTADRVTAQDRQYLWKMFELYNQLLDQNGAHDFADNTELLLSLAESGQVKLPTFSYVVVDEAQDLTLAQMQLIGKLVAPQANSITIVADMAQQIYGKNFSWKETGITIPGARSFEFTHNYRNTRQIAEAAYALLNHEEEKTDFTSMVPSTREGEKPLYLDGDGDELVARIRARLAKVPKNETVVVAAATGRLARKMMEQIADDMHQFAHSTFYSLKGCQYDHVILWNVCDANILSYNPDENDISKARKLLYVAMTRACKTVTLTTTGRSSRFIKEIPGEMIDVVRLSASFEI